jgi:hypothetical protein
VTDRDTTRDDEQQERDQRHLIWSETLDAAATAGFTQALLGRVPAGPERRECR